MARKRLGFGLLVGLALISGHSLAAEPPGADLSKPLSARPAPDPEEITVTGKSRFQLEVEAHRRELAKLERQFGNPGPVPSFSDRYLPGTNILDPSTWDSRANGLDLQRAHLLDKVTSEAVRGHAAW
jgi:hypothetical protein